MGSRTSLQTLLETTLGSRNVYFQPPASVKMRYPAIVYSRSSIRNTFSNNAVYTQSNTYTVTVIDTNPESTIVDSISKLPKCRFDRHYSQDNLNHDVFTLVY